MNIGEAVREIVIEPEEIPVPLPISEEPATAPAVTEGDEGEVTVPA